MLDDKDKYPIKEDPKEKYHSFKAFSRVTNIIYSFIATLILGLVLGYFLKKHFENDCLMVISIVVFSLIGIINFYRYLLRLK